MLLLAAVALAAPALQGAGFDHAPWDQILKAYVNEIGEVDYARLQGRRADLDTYVRRLEETSPGNRPGEFPTRAHELAYWINAYNAFVMRGVVDGYPTRSVRNLGALYGFFRRRDYTAGGVKISLLDLEDDLLRKKYKEPRIHFAIVCASLSCPFLAREAYTGERLEAQLDLAARRFINQRRSLTIDPAANQITLAGLFDLRDYRNDFEAAAGPSGRRGTLLDYLRRYASKDNLRALDALKHPRLKFHDYDWSLNEPGSRARAKNPYERELAAGAGKSAR